MKIEDMKKNDEFLIKTITGKEIPGECKIRCRYKMMVQFAKIYGFIDPKYVGPEEEGIIACRAFANYYSINSLYFLVPGFKIVQEGKERPFLQDMSRFPSIHVGNKYNWDGCVDVKNGDVLISRVRWSKIWLVEKSMNLFWELLLTVKNQNDELVCRVTNTSMVRGGGY